MTVYVRVQLANAEHTAEWREVEAETVDEAIKLAEEMPGVEVCLEATTIQGSAVSGQDNS